MLGPRLPPERSGFDMTLSPNAKLCLEGHLVEKLCQITTGPISVVTTHKKEQAESYSSSALLLNPASSPEPDIEQHVLNFNTYPLVEEYSGIVFLLATS